ncbi:phytoene desaturase family protein [Phreatobacter sp. AB_2022a]|uniref:phytoene desaturase family protein n=1 Tax=Phreatobacter sp. AB_2022a TaxID=3003134 RepID=UPI0022874AB1|nr:FAD-dependent oxidoreductase [Phreatobacter sp. AB_2022a]MCZ0736308.1 FAD-dependent oxidoreductase [Phreatobacter sp. AB_2022a]
MQAATSFDAVVIGAGAGGCCAAARLAHAGLRTLLVEARDVLGGRASTEIIDGHKVNVGAIALEFDGVFEETFRTVGADLPIRMPKPANAFYLDRKVVDVGKGGWGLLLGGLTKQAARILDQFAQARTGSLPDGRLSTKDWLSGYTKNETVHAIFRNLCAAIFACNADELPARAFLTYFTAKGAFKKFGFHPDGTIGAWKALAGAVERNGEVWLDAPVERIEVADGAARAVVIRRDGESLRIPASIVISNAGPKATVALAGEAAFPADYLRRVREDLKPAANIVFNFASREPLIAAPGIVTFGKTRRLCNLANLTATCPEIAPSGWHQYVAYAVPVPALGDFDAEAETALAHQDLRDQFPGFDDKVKMLSVRVMRDDWPAQRSCAGYDLPRETGIEGLWCVGDAVKDYGNGGTQACAETAKLVVDAIVARRGQP